MSTHRPSIMTTFPFCTVYTSPSAQSAFPSVLSMSRKQSRASFSYVGKRYLKETCTMTSITSKTSAGVGFTVCHITPKNDSKSCSLGAAPVYVCVCVCVRVYVCVSYVSSMCMCVVYMFACVCMYIVYMCLVCACVCAHYCGLFQVELFRGSLKCPHRVM